MVSLSAVLVVLFACGTDSPARSQSETTPTREETNSPDSQPPPTPESEEILPPGVEPTAEGLLNPGTYRTSIFEPPVTFTVGKGWRIPFEEADSIVIARKLEPRDEVIYMDSSQFDADLDGALLFAQKAFTSTTGVARDFRFSRIFPVRIGGFRGRGRTMDVRTDQLVVTLALGTEAYEVRPGDRLHLAAISVDRESILVFVEAPGAGFESFLDEATPVLESLKF